MIAQDGNCRWRRLSRRVTQRKYSETGAGISNRRLKYIVVLIEMTVGGRGRVEGGRWMRTKIGRLQKSRCCRVPSSLYSRIGEYWEGGKKTGKASTSELQGLVLAANSDSVCMIGQNRRKRTYPIRQDWLRARALIPRHCSMCMTEFLLRERGFSDCMDVPQA